MRVLKKALWPSKVTLDSDWKKDINDVEEWLGENLGTFKGRWNVIYNYNKTDFYFRNEEDAIIFKLTWA
jgi:hypothetical protein